MGCAMGGSAIVCDGEGGVSQLDWVGRRVSIVFVDIVFYRWFRRSMQRCVVVDVMVLMVWEI